MLENMVNKSFMDVKDVLDFSNEELNSLKQTFKDKDSRIFFEKLKNYQDDCKKALYTLGGIIKNPNDNMGEVKDTPEYNALLDACKELIWALMRGKNNKENYSKKVGGLFTFVAKNLEK